MSTIRISIDKYPENGNVCILNGANIGYNFYELKLGTLDRVEEAIKAMIEEIRKVRDGEYEELRTILLKKGYDLA